MNKWLDLHAHVNMLEISVEECLQLAAQNGVERIVTIGTCPDDNPVALSIAQKNYPTIHCCIGIHPHDAKDFTPEAEQFLRDHLSDREVVGLGEIGLDYYYDHSPRELQKTVFDNMIALSIEADLPIQVHTRDADKDTIDILEPYKGQVKGIIHCFTGTPELAKKALDIGLNISISGVATFKKADELRDIVKMIPIDRLHVETDSPFLAPAPHRGKKNHPGWVVHTAEVVAALKGLTMDELCIHTKANAKNLFSKLNWN